MEKEVYQEYLKIYVAKLLEEVGYLQTAQLPHFNSLQIDCNLIDENLNIWIKQLNAKDINKDCPILYYISFSDDYNYNDILEAATKAKIKLKKIALPKVNKTSQSNILYVGKTNSNFPSRLRYHLGLTESKTYALNLKYWASNYKFTLHFAKLSLSKDDIKYLEMMESALHHSLKPLLGRSGH